MKCIPTIRKAWCLLRMFAFGAGGLLFSTGCVTSYSHSSPHIQSSYQTGRLDEAIRTVEAFEGQPRNQPLTKLEKGNLLLAAGRVDESGRVFASLIEPMVKEEDNRPVIDLSGFGGAATASTFRDDRSMTYQVQGYELVLAMQYRSFTFLFQGNLDSAVVEMRRAARIQENIRGAYQRDVGFNGSDKAALEDRVGQVMNRMGSLLGSQANSWSNAGVWWLSGVLREAAGEPSVAQIDFQRAFELQPDNPVFVQELMRLLKENDPSRFRELAAKHPDIRHAIPPPDKSSSVVVVYEEGLAPLLVSDTFLLFWPEIQTVNVSVPVMLGQPYRPGSVAIRTQTSRGAVRGATSVQALSARALEERMPGIMWRNILRNLTRVVINEASEEANENWEAAINMFLLIKGALEEADTRSWSTLPLGMQTGRLRLKPGEHEVWVDTPRGSQGPYTFQLQPGQTGLIYLRDTGGYRSWYQTQFPRGGPAVFGTGTP